MMGMFPADTTTNQLSEWQQQNAVPPIADFDFTPWITEMGTNALPYGFNVFPIEQLGIKVDRMLSINEDNCERFKKEFSDEFELMENQNTEMFVRNYPQLADTVLEAGGTLGNFCEYLDWAYYTGVSLSGEWDYDQIRAVSCMYNSLQRVSMMNKIDITDKNLISGSFLKELNERITLITTQTEPTDPNAAKNPVFFNYQVLNLDILNVIGRAMFDPEDFQTNFGGSKGILPPSSNIYIEVRKDPDDTRLYTRMNDVSMKNINCGTTDWNCLTSTFLYAINNMVQYDNMETACADMSNLQIFV